MTIYPYSEVAKLLPQDAKKRIDEKTLRRREAYEACSENLVKPKKTFPTTLVLGIITFLGGVFLALAAHQIFPYGVNAISNLGLWGKGASYAGLGLGTILTLVGIVKRHLSGRPQLLEHVSKKVETFHDNTEASEMANYFLDRLKQDELFVFHHESKNEIIVYFYDQNGPNCAAMSHVPQPEKGLQDFLERFPENATKKLIDITTLKQRTDEFEKTKEKESNAGSNLSKDRPSTSHTLESSSSRLRKASSQEKFRVPEQVKAVLDSLFDGVGGIEKIPDFSQNFVEELPSIEEMETPIMKGVTIDKYGLRPKPFIAIKMQCLTTRETLAPLLGSDIEEVPSRSIKEVYVIFQYRESGRAFWGGYGENKWEELSGGQLSPSFFNGNFTYANNGKLAESQTENFNRLQKLIQEGKGKDRDGVEWGLIRD